MNRSKNEPAANEHVPHPGEVLLNEFMVPLGLTASRLAAHLRVTHARMREIVAGRRGITVETAMRLSQLLGTTAESWLLLQMNWELNEAGKKWTNKITHEIESLENVPYSQAARTMLPKENPAKARKKEAPPPELSAHEKKVFRQLSEQPVHFDVLSDKTGLDAGPLAGALVMLEMAGLVKRLVGDRYVRLARRQ